MGKTYKDAPTEVKMRRGFYGAEDDIKFVVRRKNTRRYRKAYNFGPGGPNCSCCHNGFHNEPRASKRARTIQKREDSF